MTNTFVLNIQGKEFLIDTEDKEKVLFKNWILSDNGYAISCVNVGQGYNRYTVNLPLHKFVLGFDAITHQSKRVDHINQTKTDCRKVNLRICSDSQNKLNRPKANIKTYSVYKGVSWHKLRKTYVSTFGYKYTVYNLLSSPSEIECAYCYNLAALLIGGDFACINRIPEELKLIEGVKKELQTLVIIKLKFKGKTFTQEQIDKAIELAG